MSRHPSARSTRSGVPRDMGSSKRAARSASPTGSTSPIPPGYAAPELILGELWTRLDIVPVITSLIRGATDLAEASQRRLRRRARSQSWCSGHSATCSRVRRRAHCATTALARRAPRHETHLTNLLDARPSMTTLGEDAVPGRTLSYGLEAQRPGATSTRWALDPAVTDRLAPSPAVQAPAVHRDRAVVLRGTAARATSAAKVCTVRRTSLRRHRPRAELSFGHIHHVIQPTSRLHRMRRPAR